MRWMAIDHGTRRMGVALSDPTETLVTPYSVIPNEGEKTAERIAAVVRQEAVDAVVIGLPRHRDGAESATAGAVREFAAALAAALEAASRGQAASAGVGGIPIRFWDETLSSVEAERLLAERRPDPKQGRETGRGRRATLRARGRTGTNPEERRRKLDAIAAAVILEDLLSSRRSRGIPPDSLEI